MEEGISTDDIPMVPKVIEDGEERIVAEIPQDGGVGVPVKVCGAEGVGNDPSDPHNGL